MKSILLILAIVGAANGCKFPPSLWCESKETAAQCKVYDQCQEFVWKENLQAPLVSFELYYEALCPFCQQLVQTQLYPTYSKIGAIMNVTLVPYGNARERKLGDKWIFTCQHGKKECIGNLLETCAIHHLGTMPKIIPLISCMESSRRDPMTAFKSCATKLAVPEKDILTCYIGSEGNRLEHQMALRTDALNPPHKYVPWVVLNGVHTEKINSQAQDNLLKLICDTYTGPKPPACPQSERKRSSLWSGI